MSKRKERREKEALFAALTQTDSTAMDSTATESADETNESEDGETLPGHDDAPISDTILAQSPQLSVLTTGTERRPLPKMKKFRFQLLHQWLIAKHAPCRVADVGGGKGLLAYLLQESGWRATVIDPISQPLPPKYKDLTLDRQVKVPPTASVPHDDRPFAPEMAANFDLLVAMHAHGCNMLLLEACATYHRPVLLLPCCIIHEPILPPQGVHWLQCVVDEALRRGLTVEPFRLNFKGQNIGLYVRGGGGDFNTEFTEDAENTGREREIEGKEVLSIRC